MDYKADESGLNFNFRDVVHGEKLDASFSVWPAADFYIELSSLIWLVEVKVYSQSGMSPQHIQDAEVNLMKQIQSGEFFSQTLRGKLLGSISYLTLDARPPTKPVSFIVILDAPSLTITQLQQASDRMKQLVIKKPPWNVRLNAMVVSVDQWNMRFPDYFIVKPPAPHVPSSP